MSDVKQRIAKLTEDRIHLLAATEDKAMLAVLRTGLGKAPGDVPEISEFLFRGMDKDLMGKGLKPSYAEWAVYAAMTLFSLHQQGNDIKKACAHVEGRSFSRALAIYAKSPGVKEENVTKRLNVILKARPPEGTAYYLRNIIPMLRGAGLGFDYGRLASDLFLYQGKYQSGIRLSWARDYYRECDWIEQTRKNNKKEDHK